MRPTKVRFDVGQVFNLPAFHGSSGRLKTCPTTFGGRIKIEILDVCGCGIKFPNDRSASFQLAVFIRLTKFRQAAVPAIHNFYSASWKLAL